MSFPFLWPHIAPAIMLSIWISALTAPWDVWVNVLRGDYPPGAKAFWPKV